MKKHGKENKAIVFALITAVFVVLVFATGTAGAQETSGSFADGSIRVGFDNRTCDATLEGSIRYNSGTSCAEHCDGTNWVCPSAGGGGGAGTCTSYTGAVDAFTFPDALGFINTLTYSDVRDVTGLGEEVVHACATGSGSPVVGLNGVNTGAGPSALIEGSDIQAAVTAPATGGDSVTATLTIGTGFSTTFTVYAGSGGYAWGHGGSGRRGDGTTATTQTTPIQISGGGTWTAIAGSEAHSCGIKSDGTAWCWGLGQNGRLGDGNTVQQTAPVQVSGAGTWTAIAAGQAHSCGIKSDGTAWCWGNGTSGRRGDGSTTNTQTTPVLVSGGGTWTTIAAGEDHSCGIKSDGTAWCWGNGNNGQVGDGIGASGNTTPRQVSGAGTWTAITAGLAHSCGVKSDGTAWCWGYGLNGRLGNGGTGNQLTPAQVSGAGTWTHIAAGEAHSCGIKSDGTAWCWGNGASGRLGNGSTSGNQLTPVQVSGAGTWIAIAAGDVHSCGIKSDNTAWCWGSRGNGRLGDGLDAGSTGTPVQVSGAQSWLGIAIGYDHTLGIGQ